MRPRTHVQAKDGLGTQAHEPRSTTVGACFLQTFARRASDTRKASVPDLKTADHARKDCDGESQAGSAGQAARDQPEDEGEMNELALFAGAGGGILGGKLLGWRTVCAVEWEPYPASVLCARQNDGVLPTFPIWDDVQTFDGRAWKGIVDVISGGFPCQDISVAGKGAGITGQRSGMWSHMARIIGEVRPRFVFVENSSALIVRGLGIVLSDLAEIGYDCRWTVLGAADVGAPHQRDRFWLVARDANRVHVGEVGGLQAAIDDASGVCEEVSDPDRVRLNGEGQSQEGQQFGGWREAWGEPSSLCCEVANSDCMRQSQPQGRECNQRGRAGNCGLSDASCAHVEGQRAEPQRVGAQQSDFGNAGWWLAEPDVGRVANGVAARVDRLKAIGNGQVPLCAATAWRLLNG